MRLLYHSTLPHMVVEMQLKPADLLAQKKTSRSCFRVAFLEKNGTQRTLTYNIIWFHCIRKSRNFITSRNLICHRGWHGDPATLSPLLGISPHLKGSAFKKVAAPSWHQTFWQIWAHPETAPPWPTKHPIASTHQGSQWLTVEPFQDGQGWCWITANTCDTTQEQALVPYYYCQKLIIIIILARIYYHYNLLLELWLLE